MNKIKELTDKIRENYDKEHTFNMTSAFSKDKLLEVLDERIAIMSDACKEHERLIALANELIVKVEDKYKDLLEEVVWEKMQQVEITKKEIDTVKTDIEIVKNVQK